MQTVTRKLSEELMSAHESGAKVTVGFWCEHSSSNVSLMIDTILNKDDMGCLTLLGENDIHIVLNLSDKVTWEEDFEGGYICHGEGWHITLYVME